MQAAHGASATPCRCPRVWPLGAGRAGSGLGWGRTGLKGVGGGENKKKRPQGGAWRGCPEICLPSLESAGNSRILVIPWDSAFWTRRPLGVVSPSVHPPALEYNQGRVSALLGMKYSPSTLPAHRLSPFLLKRAKLSSSKSDQSVLQHLSSIFSIPAI